MTDWIQLDPDSLNVPQELAGPGVRVNAFMSPYDIPQEVRGRFDAATRRLIIEFKYVSAEPLRDPVRLDRFALVLGKHSGRLYSIGFTVPESPSELAGLRASLPGAMQATMSQLAPMHSDRKANYELARKVIESERDVLLDALGNRPGE